jgi:heavy metal efflux system protein
MPELNPDPSQPAKMMRTNIISLTNTSFALIFIVMIFWINSAKSQTSEQRFITMNDAIIQMVANNPNAKNAGLSVEYAQAQKGSAIEFDHTDFSFYYGQMNSDINDRYFEVNQNFGSPLAHYYKGKLIKEQLKYAKTRSQITMNELISYLKYAWFDWVFAQNKLALIESEVLIYENNLANMFSDTTPVGQDPLLLTMAQTKYAEIQSRKFGAGEDYKLATNQIKQLLYTTENIAPADTTLEMYAIIPKTKGPDKFYPATHINLYTENLTLKKWETKYERAKLFPEIKGGYFNQEINHVKGFEGVTLGLAAYLWFLPQKTKIKQAAIQQKIAQNELDYQKFSLEIKIENLKIQLDQYFVQISFYSENALKQAEMIEQSAIEKYNANTLPMNEFLDQIDSAYTTRMEFLEIIKKYNQTAIELEYLVN